MSEPDYGPQVRRVSGRVIAPESVEVRDRPDPDAPKRTVRGAQRVDWLARILAAKDADRERFQAAERFRTDVEMATGSVDGSGAAGRSPWGYSLPVTIIDAASRVRGAWEAVGASAGGVVTHVVLGRAPLTAWAIIKGVRYGTARGMLMDALDRLVAHYERVDGNA